MFDAPCVGRARSPDHADNVVALSEQQFGKVRSVLPGDTRDECSSGHQKSSNCTTMPRHSESADLERIDVAVIGGGVTGLAAARAIASSGSSTVVLERHPRPGLDTSTHNSGVIHAGIYYPAGTLKARLCVEGRHLLYRFCAEHSVPHRRCGKLIVGTDDDEVAGLEALLTRGHGNGVEGLALVDSAFVAAREPHVRSRAALYSPETGIVNAEELVKTLLRTAQAAGVMFLPGTRLLGAEPAADGIVLRTEREKIVARQVVNAAGLYADDVSNMLGGEQFTIYPCRGEYAQF